MAHTYRPRGMPARYLTGAPEIVRREIIDLIRITPAAPLDFDIVLRQPTDTRRGGELCGLDFGAHGEQGCHFFLPTHEMRDYRRRNRRKRVAWHDIPEPTQSAILRYLNEPA